ncbi:endonuclease domain-containing protein [Ferribacterium limneticum]|uniref:endonuclease domain-containing protein n=1 Tax=Ferribacterium limneticum TaxID=76259 RepID=UPI001CFAA2BD|nr:DUF559 domain-containing protein [Ferribacterium limneticum]UCV28630.1 endonuclease domain-containing protein [Ferribacterium limneticum]UCV32547.1 endonuclease domain-containing protein [Ferribacterium limneticum]
MHGQSKDWLQQNRIPQQLRNNATDAERLIWQYLRGNRLGVKFRRQHPFNGFVLDFVSLEAKLVVELDGGQHAEVIAEDEARTQQLKAAGFRVLRFWNNQVFQETEAVIELIMAALAETGTHPHPSPPLAPWDTVPAGHKGEGVHKANP